MSKIKNYILEKENLTFNEIRQKLKTQRIIETLKTRNQKHETKYLAEILGIENIDIKIYKDFDFENIFKFLENYKIKLKASENLLKLLSQCDLLVFSLLKAFSKKVNNLEIEILEFKKFLKNEFGISRQTVESSFKKLVELELIEIAFKKIKIKKLNLILNQKNQINFVVNFKNNLLFCLISFGREFAKKIMLLKWLKKQNKKGKALNKKIKNTNEKILSNNLFNSSKNKKENASRIKKAIAQILYIFSSKKYENVFCIKYNFENSVIKRFRTFNDEINEIKFC